MAPHKEYPLQRTLTLDEASQISGNASLNTKKCVVDSLHSFMRRGTGFADYVGGKLEVTEISIVKKPDEPKRLEGRVVCEITVAQDMLNGSGNIHGACLIYLIDDCSSLPISALDKETGGRGSAGVSQAIDTVFHSPAREGDRLRIVNTSITLGSRIKSARCEIWNVTHHRLVASGVQVKMEPSRPKL